MPTMYYCVRCESWQARGELHFCQATERYKKAKAEGRVIYEEFSAVHKNAPKHRAETAKAVNMPEIVNKIAPVNTESANEGEIVNTMALVNAQPVNTDAKPNRNDYHREYMRKKRAGEQKPA
jgi:hypothetical protein